MSIDVADRTILDYEQAVSRLEDGDRIHVVSNPGYGLMIGADWDREKVLEFFRDNTIELAGPIASASGHGLASADADRRLFFKTKEVAE